MLCLCQKLCKSWDKFGLGIVLHVHVIFVMFEPNTSSLGLLYYERAPGDVTYKELIATSTSGEPAVCAGALGCQVLRYQRGGAPIVMNPRCSRVR